MAYTDTDLTDIKIKKQHLTELQTSIQSIIDSKNVSVTIGTLDFNNPTSDSYKKLQTAINNIESAFSNNCCQSCQSYTSCQSCQSCQRQCDCNCDCSDDGNCD